MLVYVFRAGDKAGVWQSETTDVATLLEHFKSFAQCRRRQRTWGVFGGVTQQDLCTHAASFVVSELVVPPHNPKGSRPRVTHALAHREKAEPDTVFIAVTATENYYRAEQQAGAAWVEKQKAIRQQIRTMKPTTKRWEDLPQSGQARLRGSSLTPDQCWIWKPLKHLKRKKAKDRIHHEAPYRDFYLRIVGPIPANVVLRHTCDNRMCMNPNHLKPGTIQDNVKDMVARGRHALQIAAREKIGT